MVEHRKEHVRGQDGIGECPVLVPSPGEPETFSDSIEAVARFSWKETARELQAAEALGQLYVSPAALLLMFKEGKVEAGVMGDEGRSISKCEELRENTINRGSESHIIVVDPVDLLRFPWNLALRVHKLRECGSFFEGGTYFQPETSNLNDPMTERWVESRCLDIENG